MKGEIQHYSMRAPDHPRSSSPVQNLKNEATDWSNIILSFVCLEYSWISQCPVFSAGIGQMHDITVASTDHKNGSDVCP